MKAPHPPHLGQVTPAFAASPAPRPTPAARRGLARVRQAGRVIRLGVQWTFRIALLAFLAWLGWAALASALPGAGGAWAQRFEIAPADTVLAGEPVQIRLSGLPAGAEVQLHSQRQATAWPGAPQTLAAQARFRVGGDGRLDLATATPLAGY